MFTGLIEEVARVVEATPTRLGVEGRVVLEDAKLGDSIAVNGVCLTITDLDQGSFGADVTAETLRRTNLGSLAPGQPVNLERALRADARLGGHIVQGHVDGVGALAAREEGNLAFAAPRDLAKYIARKGAIAINGVSLTVAAVDDAVFTVALIPATLAGTNLGGLKVGDTVNLEVDIVAKYLERLVRQ
ncbi:MAG: riboflavin synthase [Bifidobacteriaceae bacterium]|jgi:riboflavin synthase|nr:riboflavin synthase [Bifidobacteriaceae bacterium]